MARTAFAQPEANIVVSTDGYFDVYPTSARLHGDKPAYRGAARGARRRHPRRGRPPRGPSRDRPQLADAVTTWSTVNGAAAVRGDLGRGRDGKEPIA